MLDFKLGRIDIVLPNSESCVFRFSPLGGIDVVQWTRELLKFMDGHPAVGDFDVAGLYTTVLHLNRSLPFHEVCRLAQALLVEAWKLAGPPALKVPSIYDHEGTRLQALTPPEPAGTDA